MLYLTSWSPAGLQAEASRQALLRDLRSAGLAAMLRLHRHAERVAAEYAARVVAEQTAARAAISQKTGTSSEIWRDDRGLSRLTELTTRNARLLGFYLTNLK